MNRRSLQAVTIAAAAVAAFSVSPIAQAPPAPVPLTVHEWGTFTSGAGPDGNAVDWTPQAGRSDLPCFVARNRFNATRSRCDGFFFDNTKRPDLAGGPDVGAAAELHGITVKRVRRSADLQHANRVAVFFTEKLNDILSLFRFVEWNFSPRNRRTVSNFFVHQLFHVVLLFRLERRA